MAAAARAAARPAVVRSRMRSRSNSARAAKTWKTSLPPGGGGVDGLLEAPEPDAALGEAGDGVDQMPQGAAEPVEFPDDQGDAGPQLVQYLLEDGPVGAGAAGGLGEHPVAASTLEGVDLKLGVLVSGRDAGVAEQMSHAGNRRRTLGQGWLCDVDFGHGFWTPIAALAAGE